MQDIKNKYHTSDIKLEKCLSLSLLNDPSLTPLRLSCKTEFSKFFCIS